MAPFVRAKSILPAARGKMTKEPDGLTALATRKTTGVNRRGREIYLTNETNA